MFPKSATESLNESQLRQIADLPAEQRGELFFQYCQVSQQVIALQGEQGFIMFETDNQSVLPVWAHTDIATAWATETQTEVSQVTVLSLADFRDTWLPGLTTNKVSLLLNAVANSEANHLMTAAEVAATFDEE